MLVMHVSQASNEQTGSAGLASSIFYYIKDRGYTCFLQPEYAPQLQEIDMARGSCYAERNLCT